MLPRPARVLIITEMRFGFNYLIADQFPVTLGAEAGPLVVTPPWPRMVRLGPGCEACEGDPRDDLGCQPVRCVSATTISNKVIKLWK